MTQPPNILLITVDTLRADHLSCYGYHRPTSPNIDRLAAQGTLAERFFCAGLPTQPSYTTLYTGQHPVTHGVVAHAGRHELAKDAPFLPQILLAEGYTTCAVDNLARSRSWFGRGYEYYIDPSVRRALMMCVTCEELNARILPWLSDRRDERFFLLLHYWDPHCPLVPPAQYRSLWYEGDPTDQNNRSLEAWWRHPLGLGALARDTWLRRPWGHVTDAAYVEALYDQEIRYLDDQIGILLATMDELGLTDDTLVVFLADHGESLTEHGIFFEHYGLYDCTLRVPFIARWPGRIPQGQRLPQFLQHQDITPTLLDALGLPVPEEMDGQSHWPLLATPASVSRQAMDAVRYSASSKEASVDRDRIYSCECTWQKKWCVRTWTRKLILAREPDVDGNPDRELYDLIADPAETRNLAEAELSLAAELEDDLENWIAARLVKSGQAVDPLHQQAASGRDYAN